MSEKTEITGLKETEPEGLRKFHRSSRTAIVLAGGKGRRMGTVEKALLEFEGKTILERVLESLFQVVDQVILSVRDSRQKDKFNPVLEKFPDQEIRFCFDTLEDAGPLEGIRAGLLKSGAEYSFVCAGDMPFLNSRVVDLLFEKVVGHNAALPRWEDGKFEPLHAVYSKKLVPAIDKAFERGRHSVLAPVFEMQDIVFIEISEIRSIDPGLKTFVNINTIDDAKKIF